MNQFTYTEGNDGLRVYLNKKRVGTIKWTSGGFAYFPIGHKEHGPIFTTLAAVKRDIEAP